jgi:hypothetical protein
MPDLAEIRQRIADATLVVEPLTALQEFGARLWYATQKDIEANPSTIGQSLTQTIEVLARRLRIFLANLAIALGWALKGSCQTGAYWLVATARWLVPEAERFLVLRTASHNHYRRISSLRSI